LDHQNNLFALYYQFLNLCECDNLCDASMIDTLTFFTEYRFDIIFIYLPSKADAPEIISISSVVIRD
jgi:hypothetical protein